MIAPITPSFRGTLVRGVHDFPIRTTEFIRAVKGNLIIAQFSPSAQHVQLPSIVSLVGELGAAGTQFRASISCKILSRLRGAQVTADLLTCLLESKCFANITRVSARSQASYARSPIGAGATAARYSFSDLVGAGCTEIPGGRASRVCQIRIAECTGHPKRTNSQEETPSLISAVSHP